MLTAQPPTTRPTRNRRRATGAALAMVAALTLGGCAGYNTTHRETRVMQVPHIAGTALHIQNANGTIEALARDREDVSLEVKLYGPDLERLGFANVHADRTGDSTLRVWVEWPGGQRRGGEGAAISVNIPDADGVTARTTNGHIVIEGLAGHADLESSNGAIRADKHDGSVHAVTTNGSLQAEHISGPIEMFSTNGRILVTDAFGPIRAETTNAGVYISTMDGNRGPLRVRTTNGRIDLDLGEGFEGILRCDTSNGKVQVSDLDDARLVESSSRSVELRIGDSDEVSAARTTNGSIRVRGR